MTQIERIDEQGDARGGGGSMVENFTETSYDVLVFVLRSRRTYRSGLLNSVRLVVPT